MWFYGVLRIQWALSLLFCILEIWRVKIYGCRKETFEFIIKDWYIGSLTPYRWPEFDILWEFIGLQDGLIGKEIISHENLFLEASSEVSLSKLLNYLYPQRLSLLGVKELPDRGSLHITLQNFLCERTWQESDRLITKTRNPSWWLLKWSNVSKSCGEMSCSLVIGAWIFSPNIRHEIFIN